MIRWMPLPQTLPVPDYVQALEQPVKGLRVGVPAEYFGDGLDAEVRAAVESAIERLREAGCSDSSRVAAAHQVCDPHLLPGGDR